MPKKPISLETQKDERTVKPKVSESLGDAFIVCPGSELVHPPAYLNIKVGPTGIYFSRCAICRFNGFYSPRHGWDKARWMKRADIVKLNRDALILP
jgi:hypothetical protein